MLFEKIQMFSHCGIFLYYLLPRFKNNKQYVIDTNASLFFKWEDAKRLLMFLVLICLVDEG
jgi:hypothetical protein